MPNTVPHYRPFLLTKRGEFTTVAALTPSQQACLTPVFRVHPRERNFDTGGYKKTVAEHLSELPLKVFQARGGKVAFIDIELLDDESAIGGLHPLEWFVTAAAALTQPLIPMLSSRSSAATIFAASRLHSREGLGIGLRLEPGDWPAGASPTAASIISIAGVPTSDIDLFLDMGDAPDTGAAARIITELSATSAGSWRSVTVGGAAWPGSAPTPKGVTDLHRHDWGQYREAYRSLKLDGAQLPDFFDFAIANRDPSLPVDPKFLSISASFRYALADTWLFVRGELYRAPGKITAGGGSVAPMLTVLRADPRVGTPLITGADTWIDSVLAGGKTGNSETWRRWGTERHIVTTLDQLASAL